VPDAPQDLLDAIEDQAQARVRMDVVAYAKYLTPEAVDSLRASFPGIPPRVTGYVVLSVESSGGDWTVVVRYANRADAFNVRSRWREQGRAWRVVHAERLWEEGDRRVRA
jgi:hypothetical protein